MVWEAQFGDFANTAQAGGRRALGCSFPRAVWRLKPSTFPNKTPNPTDGEPAFSKHSLALIGTALCSLPEFMDFELSGKTNLVAKVLTLLGPSTREVRKRGGLFSCSNAQNNKGVRGCHGASEYALREPLPFPFPHGLNKNTIWSKTHANSTLIMARGLRGWQAPESFSRISKTIVARWYRIKWL